MSTEIATLLVSSPDVCGGRLRIEGTRITVNQIVTLYKQGHNAEEIADQYPHLTMAQVYAALTYYHANREEIEADLSDDENGWPSEARAHAGNDSTNQQGRLEALQELQRRLGLTPAKAAEWQDSVLEARR